MRSIIKTMTYSVMHMCVAVTVGYVITGSLALALGIGLIEPLVQTVFYHMHEALWRKAGEETPLTHSHGLL